jgi:hypothetical protein
MTIYSQNLRQVLEEVAEYPDGITTAGLAAFLNLPEDDIAHRVRSLSSKGLICCIGFLPHVRNRRALWALTLEGLDEIDECRALAQDDSL